MTDNKRLHELVRTIKHSEEAPPAYGENPHIGAYRDAFSLSQISDILKSHAERLEALEEQKESEDRWLPLWQIFILIVVGVMSVAVISAAVLEYGK